jgi:hypothetical protein
MNAWKERCDEVAVMAFVCDYLIARRTDYEPEVRQDAEQSTIQQFQSKLQIFPPSVLHYSTAQPWSPLLSIPTPSSSHPLSQPHPYPSAPP